MLSHSGSFLGHICSHKLSTFSHRFHLLFPCFPLPTHPPPHPNLPAQTTPFPWPPCSSVLKRGPCDHPVKYTHLARHKRHTHTHTNTQLPPPVLLALVPLPSPRFPPPSLIYSSSFTLSLIPPLLPHRSPFSTSHIKHLVLINVQVSPIVSRPFLPPAYILYTTSPCPFPSSPHPFLSPSPPPFHPQQSDQCQDQIGGRRRGGG